MTFRPELEAAIEEESAKENVSIGWACDAMHRVSDGSNGIPEGDDYIEVTVYSTDEGSTLRETVDVAIPEGKDKRQHARDMNDEFLGPTIAEVKRRRRARG